MYDAKKTKDRIMYLCKRRNISASKLLADLGLGANALRQLSSGRGMSSVSLMRIADYLDCSVDYLLGRENYDSIFLAEKPLFDISESQALTYRESEFLNKFADLPRVQRDELAKIASEIIDLLTKENTKK